MTLLNENKLLVTVVDGYGYAKVYKFCLDGSCEPQFVVHTGYGSWSDLSIIGSVDFQAIAAGLPDSDSFLFADFDGGRIFKCSAAWSTMNDCTVWANELDPVFATYEDCEFSAISIVHSVVYVADQTGDRIYAFTLKGVYLGILDVRIGAYGLATTLAIRPGVFAPLSTIATPPRTTLTAGEQINLSLDLRDGSNAPITSTSSSPLPQPDRFTSFAVGEIDIGGQQAEVSFDQEVTATTAGEFFANITLNTVGRFELHLKEGTTGIQNSFQNSPLTKTIIATETDPSETNIYSKTRTTTASSISQPTIIMNRASRCDRDHEGLFGVLEDLARDGCHATRRRSSCRSSYRSSACHFLANLNPNK